MSYRYMNDMHRMIKELGVLKTLDLLAEELSEISDKHYKEENQEEEYRFGYAARQIRRVRDDFADDDMKKPHQKLSPEEIAELNRLDMKSRQRRAEDFGEWPELPSEG